MKSILIEMFALTKNENNSNSNRSSSSSSSAVGQVKRGISANVTDCAIRIVFIFRDIVFESQWNYRSWLQSHFGHLSKQFVWVITMNKCRWIRLYIWPQTMYIIQLKYVRYSYMICIIAQIQTAIRYAFAGANNLDFHFVFRFYVRLETQPTHLMGVPIPQVLRDSWFPTACSFNIFEDIFN